MMETPTMGTAPILDTDELAKRIWDRLARLGPECESQLAVEFLVAPRVLNGILTSMEKEGLVRRRGHMTSDHQYGDDEVRWGVRVR
jgi:hypothetical protein